MAITDWPEDQRPRERLIKHGPQVLSDAELLAVFLRIGVSGKSAVDLGRDMVGHFGSLNGLFSATLADFSVINGLGPAKFAQLQAVLELARRALTEELQTGTTLSSPHTVRQYLQLMLGGKHYESFAVLFLDVKNRQIIEMNGEAVLEHTRKSEDFRCLKTLDTNIILNHLDEQIKTRELPVEKRLKKL